MCVVLPYKRNQLREHNKQSCFPNHVSSRESRDHAIITRSHKISALIGKPKKSDWNIVWKTYCHFFFFFFFPADTFLLLQGTVIQLNPWDTSLRRLTLLSRATSNKMWFCPLQQCPCQKCFSFTALTVGLMVCRPLGDQKSKKAFSQLQDKPGCFDRTLLNFC